MYKPPVPWDDIRNLPLPDLALAWLRTLNTGGGSLNPNSSFRWFDAALRDDPQDDGLALRDRLSDAWAWLEAHAFIGYDPAQTDSQWMRVTALGQEAATGEDAAVRIWAEDRLPGQLDPALSAARANLLMGEYETAAFAAMKAVEVAVRQAAGLPNGTVGQRLMRDAFNKDTGALTDPEAEASEKDAVASLFAGAIGAFKNPASHRSVTFEDPTEVVEIVMLADLLLKIVRRRQAVVGE